jgi:hypothetical protein
MSRRILAKYFRAGHDGLPTSSSKCSAGVVLPETVTEKEDLVFWTVGKHAVRPMDHSFPGRSNSPAEVKEPLLHRLKI